DVGATELLADRRGDLLDLRSVLERQMYRFVAAAGQAADHGVGSVYALVIADHDPRPGFGEQPRAGGADAAAGAGDDRHLAAEILADLRRHPCPPPAAGLMLRTRSAYCHRLRREGARAPQ